MVNNNYNSGKENMFSAQIINEVNSIRNEVAGVLIRVRPDITDQEIKINHSQELEFAVKHNIPVAIMSE